MTGPRLLRPLDVLVVAPSAVLGGAELWLLSALDATDRLSVRVVLLQDGPLRAELEARGVPTTLLPTGTTAAAVAAGVLPLVRLLRRHRPEVVLANGVKAAVVAGPAGLLTGVPVVWVKHDHSFDEQLAVPLGRLCSAVVATAEEVAAPVRRRDTVVITPPRSVDPPLPRAQARTEWSRLGLDLDDRPTAVALGRRVPYKGVDDAVRALAQHEGRAWRLVVVGDDDPSSPGCGERLLELARELGVDDRVVLTGGVPGAGRLLAAFDALLVLTKPTGDPRSPSKEGFGATALEAMLAAVPVVAVAGGPVERRLEGVAGRVVPPGAPEEVALALGRLGDPTTRRRTGEEGRRLAASHPDEPTMADRLARVLAVTAGRPGAGLRTGPAMTVVVPVLDDVGPLDALLSRLVPQLAPGDEVLVVDGGSRDGTVAKVGEWAVRDQRVRLLEAPGTNIPAARNRGWEAVRTPWVAATDAGCLPEPQWLDALRAAAADGNPALVTGVYRVVARSPFERAMAVSCYPDPDEVGRPTALLRAYGALLGRSFDPTMPTNRSNAVPVEAALAVGGFDERLTTAEDVSFGRALVKAGGEAVLSREAEVAWVQRPDLASTVRMYRAYGRGDGLSGDRRLVGRDLARLVAYVAGSALLLRPGPRGRAVAAAGAGAYLSLPLVRAARQPRPVTTAALVPAALAVKDLSKALGCVEGVVARRGGR